MTKAAKAPSAEALDAIDDELAAATPAPVTGERLYDAFVARKRVHAAQRPFAALHPEEQADWEAAAAEARK